MSQGLVIFCGLFGIVMLSLDYVAHKRIDLLREQLDELEARKHANCAGAAKSVSDSSGENG